MYLAVAFFQALIATLGSLFFSEVMKFTPCTLCWYQRICMYPLVTILLIGILKKQKDIHHYVFPLSITGWVIALYHVLLYHGVIPSPLICTPGQSCTTKFFAWFGFISIPLLSLVAFSVINVSLILFLKQQKKK